VLTEEAPARFRDLEELGVRFDGDRHGHLALGLEGGHRVRRVAHAGGSATGRRILRQLSAAVVEHPAIAVLEGRRVTALLKSEDRVVGAHLDDGGRLGARAVVLASGGAAALWSRTTNPPGSYGSGLLLARVAGADLADLELVQFHPTAVIGIPGREGFLVSEAVRGEGATLIDEHGERFTDELQPRDAVAKAIVAHAGPVYLDMRAIDPGRFPNIVRALREAGRDPSKQPVPVAPASHYVMGGIVTDLEGRSTVAGLYAVGECACTGLHGANRLASNSLSECFVFGYRAALVALDEPEPVRGEPTEAVAGRPSRETRTAMWEHAGLERDASKLAPLLGDPHPLARLVARCALAREETRGAHYRTDFPATDSNLDGHHTVLAAADEEPRFLFWP
jgi:L-aspartate oxidase